MPATAIERINSNLDRIDQELSIWQTIIANRRIGIQRLSRLTGIPPGQVRRAAGELAEMGLIRRDHLGMQAIPGRYAGEALAADLEELAERIRQRAADLREGR